MPGDDTDLDVIQGDNVEQLTEALQVLQQLDIALTTAAVTPVGTGLIADGGGSTPEGGNVTEADGNDTKLPADSVTGPGPGRKAMANRLARQRKAEKKRLHGSNP